MAFADRLDAALKARDFEPLIDRTEIYAFEDWWKRIKALIGRADTVVFVLSPDAVASGVALKEVAQAARGPEPGLLWNAGRHVLPDGVSVKVTAYGTLPSQRQGSQSSKVSLPATSP